MFSPFKTSQHINIWILVFIWKSRWVDWQAFEVFDKYFRLYYWLFFLENLTSDILHRSWRVAFGDYKIYSICCTVDILHRGWRAVFDVLQNITGCTVDFLNRGWKAAFVGVIADLDNFFEIWETLSFHFGMNYLPIEFDFKRGTPADKSRDLRFRKRCQNGIWQFPVNINNVFSYVWDLYCLYIQLSHMPPPNTRGTYFEVVSGQNHWEKLVTYN